VAKVKIAIATVLNWVLLLWLQKEKQATLRGFGDENKTPRTVTFHADDKERTYLFRAFTSAIALRTSVTASLLLATVISFWRRPRSTHQSPIAGLCRAVGEIEIAEVDLIATEPGNIASQTLARIAVEDVLVAASAENSTPTRSRSSRHRCPRSDFIRPLRCGVSKRAGVSRTALVLVAGDHRLAAVKSLGWTQIDADETDAWIWQLIENLHRAELTALQRAESVAELRELVRQKEMSVNSRIGPAPTSVFVRPTVCIPASPAVDLR
jgi:hypothetical protein